MIVLGAAAFVSLALGVSCWGQPLFRDKLLVAMEAKHLSLVEIGIFGQIRAIGLLDPVFKPRKLADQSYLMGVSASGERLLIGVQSHDGGYEPKMNDEVDVTNLNGATLAKIHPFIRGMLSFCAELSPDGQSVAFGGQFARFNARSIFGLHLLEISGNMRTLVKTTEAQTPLSIGWSRDGRTIVYDLDGKVLLYHLDTDSVSFLTDGSRPTWSADGIWIAYRRPDGTAGLIRPDGTGSKSILDNVRLGWGLRWTPDGRYLLYTDAVADAIRVSDTESGEVATILKSIDGQYTEARLRWVRDVLR